MGITLYSESLLRGDIAKVVVLFYLCPIWGTIFARIFLKQKFNFYRFLSIIFGFIGLEIIIGFEKGFFIPDKTVEWIALIAGATWALGTTFFHLSEKSSALEKTSTTALFAAILFM